MSEQPFDMRAFMLRFYSERYADKATMKAEWLEFEEAKRAFLNPTLLLPLSIVQDKLDCRWWCTDGEKAWCYPQGVGSYQERSYEPSHYYMEIDEWWEANHA